MKIFKKSQNLIFFFVWFFLILGLSYAYIATTIDNTENNKTDKNISWKWKCGDTVSALWYTYTTKVWMDAKCWTAENMKHWTMIADNDSDNLNNKNEPSDNTTIEKWCYENNESYCESEWWLYTWDEAMWWWSSENEDKTKSVCWALWSGWSLPTDTQWTALTDAWATWWLWNKLWGLVNNNILPGYRSNTDGYFIVRTYGWYYWSNTASGDNYARYHDLSSGHSAVHNRLTNKYRGFSVLCMKDYTWEKSTYINNTENKENDKSDIGLTDSSKNISWKWKCGDTVSAWWYTYTTKVWMDAKCWTAENMKHWTMIADNDSDNSNNENEPSDNTTIEKWCYENNESYCESEWWLYTWDEAMWWWSSENEDKTKSVCWALWSWWSLPTDTQWTALENAWAIW